MIDNDIILTVLEQEKISVLGAVIRDSAMRFRQALCSPWTLLEFVGT